MTVKELIEKLREHDMSDEVVFYLTAYIEQSVELHSIESGRKGYLLIHLRP